MSITLDVIRSLNYKKWSARAWIDGRPAVIVGGLPVRTLSSLRGRSTCTAQLRDIPPATGDRPAQVDLLLDGYGSMRFFTGKTAERSAQSARVERSANLIDVLNLDKAVPSTISWSGVSFVDAVTELLDAAGIAAADIDSIFDPGADYELGPVYAIEITTRETLGQVFTELMSFGGTAAYVTPAGRVRVVDSPGIPAPTSEIVYARGANLSTEFGIEDAGFSIEGNESAVNVFTATGPKRPDGAIPDGTYTATGVSGKPGGQNYRFAQTDATCVAIARRECGRRARARVNLWIQAPLNPFVLPGDTILFRDAELGYTVSTPAFVLEASTTPDGGMRLQVSMGPSLVDGYGSSIAPPVADFAMRVENQLVTLAGVPVSTFLVQCEDLSRDTGGRAITARSWTATGTGASPTSSSDARPLFLFTDLAGAEITLEVTSESGESATVAKAPIAGDLQILSRIVSVATSTGWRVLATTSGWRDFSAPGGAICTAVPAFNEDGPLLSGWSTGAIYQSADALATAPTLLATLSGSIGALFVNEADPDQILAGHGSTLSRSTDGGTTWAEVYEFDDTITDCQSSPGNPNEIRVTAGEALYLSFDGATFTASATGIPGSSAEALATAPWGRAAVFSGVGSSVADAVKFEEGYLVDWSGVDLADQPADGLISITPLLDEQGYIVGTADDLIRDGALSALVLTAGAGSLYKLLWDGAQFVASLLPEATDNGAGKLTSFAIYNPIDSASATSIGYGALASEPAAPVSFPSLIAEAVALNLGVNGTPPAGWEAPGYDASSWDAATLSGYDLSVFLPGTQTLSATGIVSGETVMIARQTVTIPEGRIERARLRYIADADNSDVYINGTVIAVDVFAPEVVTYELDPALIVAGSLVIATRFQNDPVGPMGVAYILDINYEV